MLNPNIWIIQNDDTKLNQALNSIDKTSNNNFLYTNCISKFICNGVSLLSKNFNTFLYNDDTDSLILFMSNSKNNINNIKDILHKRKILYHEISLKNEYDDIINKFPNSLMDDKKSREFWVVNNESELENVLEEVEEQIRYYPSMNTKIILNFLNSMDNQFEIGKFNFEEMIITNQKIILINKSKEQYSTQAILNNIGIEYITIPFNKPRFVKRQEVINQKIENEKEKRLLLKNSN